MSRAVALTNQEIHHKERAEGYLAEARRILRRLSAERRRRRRRTERPSIVSEVKTILRDE